MSLLPRNKLELCIFASRPSRHHVDTQSLKNHPTFFVSNFLKCQFHITELLHTIELIHLNIIGTTLYKDIMPYINKIHGYGCILSILCSPLKNKTPQNFTIANFGHPVSKPWTLDPAVYITYYFLLYQITSILWFYLSDYSAGKQHMLATPTR